MNEVCVCVFCVTLLGASLPSATTTATATITTGRSSSSSPCIFAIWIPLLGLEVRVVIVRRVVMTVLEG